MSNNLVTLIHYGELSLKGRNRSIFEDRLIQNIEYASGGKVTKYRGYFILEDGDSDTLKSVFGISWFARAHISDKGISGITAVVLDNIRGRFKKGDTFGVFVKRSDKDYPLKSTDVAERVGRAVSECCALPVNLNAPDMPVYIEITRDYAFVFFNKEQGAKGLPVGVSGDVLSLLSGGIDSPVASYLAMKRGCRTDFVHFHVFTDNEHVRSTKIYELLQALGRFQPGSRVYVVPYYPFELKLLELTNVKGHELILFRRFMLKLAERIALEKRYKALVTGDSIGQVASQTIENLAQALSAVNLPVFQPLITYDKQEIVDLGKKIGTYDISVKDYKDCCSIVSKNPKTRSRSADVERLESSLNMEALLDSTADLITEYEV